MERSLYTLFQFSYKLPTVAFRKIKETLPRYARPCFSIVEKCIKEYKETCHIHCGEARRAGAASRKHHPESSIQKASSREQHHHHPGSSSIKKASSSRQQKKVSNSTVSRVVKGVRLKI